MKYKNANIVGFEILARMPKWLASPGITLAEEIRYNRY